MKDLFDPGTTRAVAIVHDLAQATAALSAGARHATAVILASAPGAVRSLGAGGWRELTAAARAAVPDAEAGFILDCGDEAGMALAAIREGVEAIALSGPEPVRAKVARIAAQAGVGFHAPVLPDLDLWGAEDASEACERLCAGRAREIANPGALR